MNDDRHGEYDNGLVPLDLGGESFGPVPGVRRVTARPLPQVPQYVPPPVRPVHGVGLTGYATPRVRQHSGDVVVVAYAVAALAVCIAVVLIAAVFGVAAYRVVAWMWPA